MVFLRNTYTIYNLIITISAAKLQRDPRGGPKYIKAIDGRKATYTGTHRSRGHVFSNRNEGEHEPPPPRRLPAVVSKGGSGAWETWWIDRASGQFEVVKEADKGLCLRRTEDDVGVVDGGFKNNLLRTGGRRHVG
jgi:hypothetical protein